MAESASGLLDIILAAQNKDGGWGYRRGGPSWSEPTVYSLLALRAASHNSSGTQRGVTWLARTQRPDGGWAPQASVDQSTWVTALVLLLRSEEPSTPSLARAIDWLLRLTGRESTFWRRARQRLLGIQPERDADSAGWPWFPDTAAWVHPTAVSILALTKLNARSPRPEYQDRIRMGHRFLLDKMCQDGGWNHGSSRALGYESSSYPETTGVALLSLHANRSEKVARGVAAAERHLRACKSAEGQSWLRLGLLAHSRPLAGISLEPAIPRTIVETSLRVIADAAAAGRNVFLG